MEDEITEERYNICMPSRKPRMTASMPRAVKITFTERERIVLGKDILAIKDGRRRIAVMADLKRLLALWAAELANVPWVLLRSDLVALTEPLAQSAAAFADRLRKVDRNVAMLMQYRGAVDEQALRRQLQGIDDFLAWLKAEPSKKGGERSSFHRECNSRWIAMLSEWFDTASNHAPGAVTDKARRKFLTTVQCVVNRSVDEATAVAANTGRK